MREKQTGANEGIIVGGDATMKVGRNVAVGRGATISETVQTEGSDSVEDLLGQMRELLSGLPRELQEQRHCIEHFVGTLESEARVDAPNKSILDITAKGLVDASKAVGDIVPGILSTASMIAEALTGA